VFNFSHKGEFPPWQGWGFQAGRRGGNCNNNPPFI